ELARAQSRLHRVQPDRLDSDAEWALDGLRSSTAPMLRDLSRSTAPVAPAPVEGPSLLDTVRHETAVVLGHASGQAVDPRELFDRMGLDSLAAVELRNRIAAATGTRLPATFIYDWPTPAHLAERLGEPAPEEGTS
ncbi:acyl carrier protein, partial [Umezawaea endophytica]|uniref:acyl carrier protein n=1 Tax=Umezawaea endophytica TaxID=1654476 RepID=UPI0035EAE6E5